MRLKLKRRIEKTDSTVRICTISNTNFCGMEKPKISFLMSATYYSTLICETEEAFYNWALQNGPLCYPHDYETSPVGNRSYFTRRFCQNPQETGPSRGSPQQVIDARNALLGILERLFGFSRKSTTNTKSSC
jgi:hypothetical protein